MLPTSDVCEPLCRSRRRAVALRPAPTGLLMRFLVWFPYPIIEGVDELPCLD